MSNGLPVGKAAQRLGIHPDTLRRWTDQGKVPAWTTPAGHRRYNAADLDALTTTHRTAATVGEHAMDGQVVTDAEHLTGIVTGHAS